MNKKVSGNKESLSLRTYRIFKRKYPYTIVFVDEGHGQYRTFLKDSKLVSSLQARPALVGMSTKNSLSETVIGRVLSAVPVTTVTSLPHAIFFGRALPSWRVVVRLHAVLRRRSSHVCIQESHPFRGESMSTY